MTPRSSSRELSWPPAPARPPARTPARPGAPPAARFRDLMAAWPTGVSVVTAGASGTPLGCTVTALMPVSTDPPLLMVSLIEFGRTLAAIRRARRFGVCVLSAAQRDLARTFATGEHAERFAGVDHGWVAGVPVLRAAATAVVCTVEQLLPVADHVLVIGRPLWQEQQPSAAPVVWFQRTDWRLCPPSGNS